MARTRACSSVAFPPPEKTVFHAFLSLFRNFFLTLQFSSNYLTDAAFSCLPIAFPISENPSLPYIFNKFHNFLKYSLQRLQRQNILKEKIRQYIAEKLPITVCSFHLQQFSYLTSTNKNFNPLFINKPTGNYEARNLHEGSHECRYSCTA